MSGSPPRSTLFPYTTLFRSRASRRAKCSLLPPGWPSAFAPCTPLPRSEEHTSELQSLRHLVCRLLLEKKKISFYLDCVQNKSLEGFVARLSHRIDLQELMCG